MLPPSVKVDQFLASSSPKEVRKFKFSNFFSNDIFFRDRDHHPAVIYLHLKISMFWNYSQSTKIQIMRLQNWPLLGLSAVQGSYSQAETRGCEPLDSFLGQFGNQWDTDCVDIYNNGTGVEQPSGTACYAQCKENENEQYLYCSCNHDNCFWVPNDIHMDQVSERTCPSTGAGSLGSFRTRPSLRLNFEPILRLTGKHKHWEYI